MPGKQKGTTPLGFTPPSDYIIDPTNTSSNDTGFTNPDGIKEIGQSVYNELESRTTQEALEYKRLSYDYFRDFGTEQFTHLLDYQDSYNGSKIERRIGAPNSAPNNAYLGSFIRTLDDNEDPTMLGFDVRILIDDSPLFNGEIDRFINIVGAWNSEVASRQSILDAFRSQLFKFLKNDNPSRTNSDGTPYHPSEFIPKRTMDGSSNTGVKVYYLKKIAGLDRLTESTDSSEIKSFIDYGKDFISLTFWEDVSQNIGYLSSLYKQLWWSRINGKSIIPQNLLRFDVEITITEIRKYNRVIKEIGKNMQTGLSNTYALNEYVDNISKYTYRLYECQFFFTGLPHGDTLDMTAPVTVDAYDMKFNYKNSTMKFTKFYDPGPLSNITRDSDLSPDNIEKYYTEIDINNASVGRKISGINTNNSSIGPGGIQHNNNITSLDLWNVQSTPPEQPNKTGSQDDTIESLRTADKAKSSVNSKTSSDIKPVQLDNDVKKALADSYTTLVDDRSVSESEGGDGTFLGQDGTGFGINTGTNQPGGTNMELSLQDSYTTLVDDRSVSESEGGDGTFLGQDGTSFGINTGTNQPGGANVELALMDSFTTMVDEESISNQNGGSIFVSGSPWDKLKHEMLKEAIGVGNAAIIATTALLNKSLGEITSTLGIGIAPPTNVYEDEYYNQVSGKNYSDFMNFVGNSVRGWFTNPNDPKLNPNKGSYGPRRSGNNGI